MARTNNLQLSPDTSLLTGAIPREPFAGVNNTTEATAVTTTYDRLFSCKKSMEAVMAKEKLGTDASKVTAKMLSDAYKKVGASVYSLLLFVPFLPSCNYVCLVVWFTFVFLCLVG